ncbi:Ricin B-related lectin [Botryosphaeria dothidea]|uniref:Ricin B-related lectin n=1 Tax=Botryosphaeria dothidea TaxID=55169 RepID=A0A8H4ITQ4_9PEZI|nr:Ricin B-related lectin [Botryosphaeria dothidea]
MFVNISSLTDISSTATYKLVNSWSLWPLAIDPTQPDFQLRAQSNNDTALEFQFRSSDQPAKYNLCAAAAGKTFCLDVYNDPKDVPHLTPWGYYSGQYWSVEPSGGSVKLSNDWTGTGWWLDVYQGSLAAHMSQGNDYAGQYWMLDRVAENVTLPPDAPDVGTTTTLPAKDPNSGGSHGLSTPAIIGISLGGGIFSAAFLLAVLALMFRRRRRRQKTMREQNAAYAAGAPPGGDNRDQLVRTPNSRTGLDPSTMTTVLTSSSMPGNGPTTPQQVLFNGMPPELESPMTTHHGPNQQNGSGSYFPNAQQRSIYELATNHEDSILPAPKPSYTSLRNKYNSDEKDPALFNSMNTTTSTAVTSSFPESPASSTMTASRGTNRNNARWEEVVPDGNGEITFSTVPRTLSGSPPPPHSAAAGGTVPATAHFSRNIAGIAYGFGGGGGMAGGAAPGYLGSAAAARDRWANGTWSSDGRASATTSHEGGSSPGGFNDSNADYQVSELDAHGQQQPPRYVEGWASNGVHEAEGDKPSQQPSPSSSQQVVQQQQQQVHEMAGRDVIRLADTPGPTQMREIVRLADMGPSPEREVVRLVDLPPSPERERGGG